MLVLIQLNTLSIPGKPRLPIIREIIRGDTSNFSISAVYKESTATHEIEPAPFPVPKNGEPLITLRDPNIYKRDRYFPEESYSIRFIGKRRNVPYYILEIYPCLYNPVKKKIKYAVELDYSKGVEELRFSKTNDKDMLLIVSVPEFIDVLDFYVFYRRVTGYEVDILEVQPGWDTSRIKYEISVRQPEYVLIIGDVSEIPAPRRTRYIPGLGNDTRYTDLYYACYDNDWLPDAYYGRISIDDVSELEGYIDKVINYDTINVSWKRKAFFMASDDIWYHELTESSQNYSMKKARMSYMIADSHFAFYSQPGTGLNSAFSNGRSISMYSGHGTVYRWQGPVFDISDINSLPQNLRTPMIFSFACNTGAFSNQDCFLEAWNEVAGKGSIISFGSSTFSFWNEDDLLQRKISDVVFKRLNIGRVVDSAKLLFMESYTGDSAYIHSYFEQYNLLGDPAIRCRNGSERKLSLSIPKLAVVGDTINAFLGENGNVGLLQGDRTLIVESKPDGSLVIPLDVFEEGGVRVIAASENRLTVSRLIYLSKEPLEDIFRISERVTVDEFTLKFFAIRGVVRADLYDVLGRRVKSREWIYSSNGEKTEIFSVENQQAGVYFIKIGQKNIWDFSSKIVKL